MSLLSSFSTGKGIGRRLSHVPPVSGATLQVQAVGIQFPHYPFQPLPTPNGPPPYRFDLSQLLPAADINTIANGTLVFHTVGDTGDHRGQQQDFVAEMMTQDAQSLPRQPAFFYHLGDVVYFAGDISMYGDNFYQTYKDYPCFIVAIPGNHDCQPDDPQDGPVDPNKVPFDGFVQNFMSTTPEVPGSIKTGAPRTQMDLPNAYWTFTTPYATILGLCSNVGETEGEIHQDQQDWFVSELQAADPNKALIVTVHHPPFSGDIDHSGSSAVEVVLTKSFQAAGRYPDMVMSGHVHNYQRFTNVVTDAGGNTRQIPFIVAGAGGYTKLGTLHKIKRQYPTVPLVINTDLTLEQYNITDFGFLRLEIGPTQINGSYLSAPFNNSSTPVGQQTDSFTLNLITHTVTTN